MQTIGLEYVDKLAFLNWIFISEKKYVLQIASKICVITNDVYWHLTALFRFSATDVTTDFWQMLVCLKAQLAI